MRNWLYIRKYESRILTGFMYQIRKNEEDLYRSGALPFAQRLYVRSDARKNYATLQLSSRSIESKGKSYTVPNIGDIDDPPSWTLRIIMGT